MFPRFIRCTICGALILAGTLAHHVEHVHPESHSLPAARNVVVVSASTTAIPGGSVLGEFMLSTGTSQRITLRDS